MRASETLEILANTTGPTPAAHLAQRTFTDRARAFREALLERRLESFRDRADELSLAQNSSALMRVANCRQGRMARPKLVRADMEQHVAHFANTFGGAPGGQPVPEVPRTGDRMLGWDDATMEKAQKRVPVGKAAGIDGLFGEFIAYGGRAYRRLFACLIEKMHELGDIPADWKRALVVPVFKNKGDPRDIRNYRPISLTSTFRRYYERLVKSRLDPFEGTLQDTQGGFRAARGTMHQVLALHEITVRNSPVQVFLDFAAAYDMVDRNHLWHRLAVDVRVPAALLRMLRVLFDDNVSVLLVGGERSREFANRRGLLQGSSLAPSLFNFFLDPMLEALNGAAVPKLTTLGTATNHLAYADDVALHARNPQEMQTLLDICEWWATRVGMRFAIAKCFVLSPAPIPPQLTIYGSDLPVEVSVDYLGMPFSATGGADWATNATNRAGKARGTIIKLAEVGVNAGGFAPAASVRLYKALVRPKMEYGLQLAVLGGKAATGVQRTQNLALRTIFGVGKTASINALHKLAQVAKMDTRNTELVARFASSLHNCQDPSVLAARMWWQGLGARPLSNSICGTTIPTKNRFWREFGHLDHVFSRMSRDRARWAPAPERMTAARKAALLRAELAALDRGKPNVAGSIQLEATDHLRHILRPDGVEERKWRTTLIRWILGGICTHLRCKACGAPVSRQHGVECAGAEALLACRLGATAAAEALAHPQGHTVIDKVLNFYRNTKAPPGVHRAIFEAISGIYTKCLGYQQQPNGFWKKPEEQQGRRTEEEEQEPDGGVPARQRQRVAYRPNPGSRRRPSGLPQPGGVG